ncbi:MAG: amidohydrolase family protein, partial [Thermoanaerobaculia bacterium]
MRLKPTFLTICSLALLIARPPLDARTLIHAGRLIDGVSNSPRTEVTIIVEGDRINAIFEGYLESEEGDEVVDLRKSTVLPGLMDMHTHLSMEFSKESYIQRFLLEPADYAIHSVVFAERTLMAGFTTVRDVGDRDNVTISLRNAINQGLVPGPRIFTAGKSLATTGGHADRSNGMRAQYQGDPGPREGIVNGPADA